MKETDLYKAFGSTPESVKSRIFDALHKPREEKIMKRKLALMLALSLLLITLLTGVVYAISTPTWLTDIIGRGFFSQKSAEDLSDTPPTAINQTFELGDLTITVMEAALLPDGKVYASAKVALKDGAPGILVHNDTTPSQPAYVNSYYEAFREPGLDLATVPTYADLARERGEKLLRSHVWIEIGTGDTGYLPIEQKDGSYVLVVENTAFLKDGENTVVLKVGALMYEMTPEGDEVEGTRIQNEWMMELSATVAAPKE